MSVRNDGNLVTVSYRRTIEHSLRTRSFLLRHAIRYWLALRMRLSWAALFTDRPAKSVRSFVVL